MLTACGFKTPDLVLSGERHAAAFLVNEIVNHVKCELREGFLAAIDYDLKNAAYQSDRQRRLEWLESWAAQITLTLEVQEEGSISPGVLYNDPLGWAIFSAGADVSASSTVTRNNQIDFFLVLSDFLRDRDAIANRPETCVNHNLGIRGNLKFNAMFDDMTFPLFIPGNVSHRPPSTFSQEVKFVVRQTASATPTWELVRITYNPEAPFLSASRTRTSGVLVTLGPRDGDTPSAELIRAHDHALEFAANSRR